jgi:hypothetical protein
MKRIMALVLVLTPVLGASIPALSETQKYKLTPRYFKKVRR